MASEQKNTATGKRPKRCFVVMGFGVKTDFATGRKLDLDKTYKTLIKPVVEAKGLECVRADEIRHSGSIDVPMYEQLLTADVVIADLSTANPNALYELGIRHALRPHTTIVVSESKLPYPFELNHVRITSYTHMGEDIGFDEVMRFREELAKTLEAVQQEQKTDSPIYTYLQDLQPPSVRRQVEQAMQRVAGAAAKAVEASQAAAVPRREDPTLSTLIAQGELAIKKDQFGEAKALFAAALELGMPRAGAEGGALLHDPYLHQRLVLATYKAKQPNEAAALDEALQLLAPLQPEVSNDPETVGLAGAIQKRLFDQGRAAEHLDRAIRYYGRGYYLRDDWYNGINLAYLLTLRADEAPRASDNERIADLVWANRIRREVLTLCERDLYAITKRKDEAVAQPLGAGAAALARDAQQEFWCFATKAEAHFGLSETEAFDSARAKAAALEPANWMLETLNFQVARLKQLLDRRGHLLSGSAPKC